MKDYSTLYGSLVIGTWPNVSAKNASGPSATDGTPFCADFISDLWGARQDLLNRAGMTPDGLGEAAGTSQTVKALQRAALKPGLCVLSFLNSTELALCRLMPLTGQVLLISNYADLVTATYCSDAKNATAPAFYKTSDSGGNTRSTAGAYFVLPDAQGMFPRAIGTNSKLTRADGNSYSPGLMGQLSQDALQDFGIPAGVAGSGSYAGYGTTSAVAVAPIAGGYGIPRRGPETKPASITVQFCISY